MVSGEGERVAFYKAFKLRGPVEKWLQDLEMTMKKTLFKIIKSKRAEVYRQLSKDWIFQTPAQVSSCLHQIFWTLEVEDALQSGGGQLGLVVSQQQQLLQQLTELIRLPLSSLERLIVSGLAIQVLHNRDAAATLLHLNAEDPDAFDWQKQLRHYWDPDKELLLLQQLSAAFDYGYEYLGAPQRLVITPLTDRCWLTIT
ncbi:hypothetical protein, conserved, partial [Eimeria tenella]